jgi:hypothetical protein
MIVIRLHKSNIDHKELEKSHTIMPRVAVHQSNGTVFAYKVGNVIDGHHNVDLLTGAVTPVEQIVAGLVKQAQTEYPHDSVVVENLQDGTWVPQDTPVTPVEAPTVQVVNPIVAAIEEAQHVEETN